MKFSGKLITSPGWMLKMSRSRLRFLGFVDKKYRTGDRCYRKRNLYSCECGKLVILFEKDVKTGNTRSCGCLQRENRSRQCIKNNAEGISKPFRKGNKKAKGKKNNPGNTKGYVAFYKNNITYEGRITVPLKVAQSIWAGELTYEEVLSARGK